VASAASATPAADHHARADRSALGRSHCVAWADIDAAASCNVLRVRRSHGRGDVRNTTKTGKRRIVPFPVELADVFSEHRRPQLESQQPGFEEGWVFPNSTQAARQRLAVRREQGCPRDLRAFGMPTIATARNARRRESLRYTFRCECHPLSASSRMRSAARPYRGSVSAMPKAVTSASQMLAGSTCAVDARAGTACTGSTN
jgi:hypothetical protein